MAFPKSTCVTPPEVPGVQLYSVNHLSGRLRVEEVRPNVEHEVVLGFVQDVARQAIRVLVGFVSRVGRGVEFDLAWSLMFLGEVTIGQSRLGFQHFVSLP